MAGALDDDYAPDPVHLLSLLHASDEVELVKEEKKEKEAELQMQLAESRELKLAIRNMPVAPSERMPAVAGAKPNDVDVVYYQNGPEHWPFIYEWQIKRSKESQQRIRDAIARMRQGNFSDSKSLHADDLFERRLRSGERIYYARISATSVVILHGGDKGDTNQDRDIAIASERWHDYRQQQQ